MRFTLAGVGCWLVIWLGTIAFWVGVAYILLHYALKFW